MAKCPSSDRAVGSVCGRLSQRPRFGALTVLLQPLLLLIATKDNIFFIFNDVMRGSNLLVTVQIRMMKEKEKRNRSLLVLIFGTGGGGTGGGEGVNM